MIFAQNAAAENWVIYAEGDSSVHYIETETIKERGGFVYFWTMGDLVEPTPSGDLSIKSYEKVDCDLERRQRLSYVFYKESMGRGTPDYEDSLNKEWAYMIPGSIEATGSRFACSFID